MSQPCSPPNESLWLVLSPMVRQSVERLSGRFRLSFQQHRLLLSMARDLQAWGEGKLLEQLSFKTFPPEIDSAAQRRHVWQELQQLHQQQRLRLPNYQRPAPPAPVTPNPTRVSRAHQGSLLGACPVASEQTRCCNLLTLDVVQRCGFGCSYCAVQHFYHDGEITFPAELPQQLAALELDPLRWYHLGTGQSSDSLLWGDEGGMLRALLAFARRQPRVLLEFKSKSARIEELLRLHREQPLPPNLLLTWSLAPQPVVEHEERLTASLDARLLAARRMADAGCKVGFHFHPIIRFRGWEGEYRQLAQRLQGLFSCDEVVTVSLGTLTFAKSLLGQIRRNPYESQILRLPLEQTAGKFSYPQQLKRELLSLVYQAFSPWHGRVFFYLCMEDPSLWSQVMGYDYSSNKKFEQDMLCAYRRKLYSSEQLSCLLGEDDTE